MRPSMPSCPLCPLQWIKKKMSEQPPSQSNPPEQTNPANPANKSMEEIVALCKRRGFVYPASEIYGGINGFWDYAPLGVQLKNNIRDSWWRHMVECPPLHPETGQPLQIVGLDSAIVQNPKVWEASGHVAGFNDPMVDCTETKKRYRADHLLCAMARVKRSDGKIEDLAWITSLEADENAVDHFMKKAKKLIKKSGGGEFECPDGGKTYPYDQLEPDIQKLVIGPDTTVPGTLTEPRAFNLMFETYVGAIKHEDNKSYLRPETAQGIFLNYKNVLDTMRVRVPFGIAQIGKAFRNEVTPRNFIFRSREFEQMEMEWFCHEDDALQWKLFWQEQRMAWYLSLGLNPDNLIFREHDRDELSHYAKTGHGTVDIEYRWPFTTPGYGELEGIAHRTNFDLKAHAEHSGAKLEYFDQEKNERYFPHVVEPAAGLTRATLAVICEAFTPTPDRKGSKYILKFAPHLAPVKVGIFPLVKKDGMPEIAQQLYMDLRGKYAAEFDIKQSIGKRYARMDEIGTPYCITIDGTTAEDQTVTVRHRDDASQERIHIQKVDAFLAEKIGS
jgi:glycyl-tRNA synthetase